MEKTGLKQNLFCAFAKTDLSESQIVRRRKEFNASFVKKLLKDHLFQKM